MISSHCKSHKWSPLCGWMPSSAGQTEAEGRHPSGSRHDHTHHHEASTQGGMIYDNMLKTWGFKQSLLIL